MVDSYKASRLVHAFVLLCSFLGADNFTLRLSAANTEVHESIGEERFAGESGTALRAPILLHRRRGLHRDHPHIESALTGLRKSLHGSWSDTKADKDSVHLS